MRQFRAILVDSFYEAVDSKSLLVLLVLCLFVIVLVAGVSFETEKPESVLQQHAEAIGLFSREGNPWNWFAVRVDFKAGDIRPATKEEGWSRETAGGYAVTITFKNKDELQRLVRQWDVFKARAEARKQGQEFKEPPQREYTTEDCAACLAARLMTQGYNHAEAKLVSQEPCAYRVAVRSDYPHEVCGAQVRLLYGAVKVPLVRISVAEAVVHLQLFLANVFGGFIGVLVAIMVCSGFVPSMLQKGTLDLVLARPIGRGRLLLYKYVGGLWFVFILATVLIGGCWLAITLRTGYANPWFLATILTITATFGVIYSVSVVVGVWTRSGLVSALVAIFVWGTSGTLIALRHWLKRMFVMQVVPAWLQHTVDVLYALAPKTSDLASLNEYFLSRSHLSEAAYQRTFATRMPPIDWGWSLGTTAAFTVAMLLLAAWFFRRRDY